MLAISARMMCWQEISVVHFGVEQYESGRVLARSRHALRLRGVAGLAQAPCLRNLLQRMPLLVQEQYAYEKVTPHSAPPQSAAAI